MHNPTRQEIYLDKDQSRKDSAKQPFREKWRTIMRMQILYYQMQVSVGKKPKRPWLMPLEEYEQEWGPED